MSFLTPIFDKFNPSVYGFRPTETKTLYGPAGEIVTLTLPTEQQRYNQLIAQGYTETQPVTSAIRTRDNNDTGATTAPSVVGTQTESAFGFGTFGQGVDWTDSEQAIKFIDGEYTPIDPKTREAVVGAGMIIGGPLALLTGAATTYDALEDISSLRASVIIAKAYGNTAAEQHAQAKLEDYLAQAPAVATGVVGDWLAKGTGKAGNLFKSLGINLSGDPEDWDNQQEELQKLRDDSKKKKPVAPEVGKTADQKVPTSTSTQPTMTTAPRRSSDNSRDPGPSGAEVARQATAAAASRVARDEGVSAPTSGGARSVSDPNADTRGTGNRETYASKVQRGGGFNKGGLASRPKKKKK